MLEIKINTAPAVDSLNALRNRQLPFAISLALNRIGAKAQAAETAGIFERFTVRRPQRLRTAVRMKPSTKRKHQVVLTVRDAFLVQHEDGAVRRPGDVYSSIVQPVRAREKRVGVLRGRNRPSEVKGAFTARMRSGKVGIFVRRGPKRLPIDLVFSLERQANLPRLLKFGATVEGVAVREWEAQFGESLREAMASAR